MKVAKVCQKSTVAKGVFIGVSFCSLLVAPKGGNVGHPIQNLWNFQKDLLCWLKWCLGGQAEIKTS